MDTGLIAFILPAWRKMGLHRGRWASIGSIGLIGMALGAVISGTVADRIGRKKVFTITVLLYSIASAFCALSWNYQSLLVFRFLVGFGLGGELPVAATLVSEYAPSRVRGRFIVLLESFWGLGWIAAACIAYFFIPVYGWRMAFLIGALPALYVCLIRLHMPESVRYLLTAAVSMKPGRLSFPWKNSCTCRRLSLRAKQNRCRSSPRLHSGNCGKSLSCPGPSCSGWSGSASISAIMASLCGCRRWSSSRLYRRQDFEYVLIMTLAQLPGYYCAAWLVDKIGRKYTLSAFLLFSGVASYFFGHASTAATLMMWGSVMSFFNSVPGASSIHIRRNSIRRPSVPWEAAGLPVLAVLAAWRRL